MGFLTAGVMRYVAGGLGVVALGLAAWCWVLSGQVDDRTKERDVARAQLAAEIAKHDVSLASIVDLKRMLDDKNRETDARGAAYAAQGASDAKAVAEADKRYAATEKKRDYLDGVVQSRIGKSDCPVSDAMRKELEGL
jgi:hypothetical protein